MTAVEQVRSGPLRYGVIGAGRVFQRFHLPAVAARSDYALVAVCDADPAQARASVGAAGAGALFTADVAEFLTKGRPDVVAVCTPNDAHVDPVLAAISTGAAVMCEKPLATSVADARRIAAAAGSSLVGVNLPYRFHPLLPAFAEAVHGDLEDIRLTFTTAGQRLWRPVTQWYADPARAGGGALIDLGPHALDLLVQVFGWPEVVDCRMDPVPIEERVDARLTFASTSAALHIDRASRIMGLRMEARQGDRTITLDLRRNQIHSSDGRLVAGDAGEAEGQVERGAIDRFLDAAAGGPGPVVGVAEAVRLQEVIASLYAVAKPVAA